MTSPRGESCGYATQAPFLYAGEPVHRTASPLCNAVFLAGRAIAL
ncbi:hypothetical protein [Komarekiella delphini-convector]|nr:hypothetical protein [Komarekiella delphini-convector]